jgi:hypothetical protein
VVLFCEFDLSGGVFPERFFIAWKQCQRQKNRNTKQEIRNEKRRSDWHNFLTPYLLFDIPYSILQINNEQ